MPSLHEDREGGRVGSIEEALVRLQRAVGCQTEAPERRGGELHGRLWAGGDEITVHDCAFVDVIVAARVSGGHEVLRCRAGVAALVQKAGSGDTGCGTADSRHWNPGVQESAAAAANAAPPPTSHMSAPGSMSRLLSAGSRSSRIMSGMMRSPPIVVISWRDSAAVRMFHGLPVKRPVRSSTRRWPTSQSARVSYMARCATEFIDNMLSNWQHVVK